MESNYTDSSLLSAKLSCLHTDIPLHWRGLIRDTVDSWGPVGGCSPPPPSLPTWASSKCAMSSCNHHTCIILYWYSCGALFCTSLHMHKALIYWYSYVQIHGYGEWVLVQHVDMRVGLGAICGYGVGLAAICGYGGAICGCGGGNWCNHR